MEISKIIPTFAKNFLIHLVIHSFIMEKLEKDLEIYDIWESPNGNLFIKISGDYSIGLGSKGNHEPHEWELKISQYVKSNNITPVKKVGRMVFD